MTNIKNASEKQYFKMRTENVSDWISLKANKSCDKSIK